MTTGSEDADNRAAVERIYVAAARGDWAAAEAELHPDLVIHEAESLPYGGSWHGREALKQLYGRVLATWQNAGFELEGFAAGDGRVVAFITMSHDTPEGRRSHRIVEVSLMRDGKVAEMWPVYWDTAELVKLESKR
jgi:ketosteroid isomerase-like protein